MNDFLFFILKDGSIRRFPIENEILTKIVELLVEHRNEFIADYLEKICFDGQYKPESDEVLYVKMPLPQLYDKIPDNTHEIDRLSLPRDAVKTLGLYHNSEYYFQCFNNQFIIRNGRIAVFFSNDTYQQFNDKTAFTIEDKVHAMYKDGMFYFQSYTYAKQIFDLTEFYKEATNKDIEETFNSDLFMGTDVEWVKLNADSVIRKQLTSLINSGQLDKIDIGDRTFKKLAKEIKINESIYNTGHIVLPKSKKECKQVLALLNEDIFEGPISKTLYRSNSKRVQK